MLEQTSLRARATATVVTALAYSMSTGEQHPRDGAQLAEPRQALDVSLGPLDVTQHAERRQAPNGYAYTLREFQQHYGGHWETFWNPATEAQPREPEGSVPQLAAANGVLDVRLDSAMVVEIRQEEAARGPPRSLQKLARDALNAVSQYPTYESQNLDDVFDWVPYVAAHDLSQQIIGPGITHAMAHFVRGTSDHNRGGAPRLDFFFYRTDQTVCRVHPGRKRKDDAQLIFQ